MSISSKDSISPRLIESFRGDGVVLIRRIFDGWIEALRRGVDRNIADPGPYAKGYTPEGESGRFFGDYCNWQRFSEYEDFILDSPAAELAATLMGSKIARIYHEHVLVKEPGTEARTPWHHDQPYYGVDGTLNVSLWMPLDPVPKDTSPEFVAGSHRWGRWFLPRMFTGDDYQRPGDGLEPIPDFDRHRDEYDIRAWDLQPGDVVAFHFLTVHGAPPNLSSTRRRRGFATRWLGEDAVYAVRSGKTSPPFPELQGRIKPGDSMDLPEFPVVWPPRGRVAPEGGSRQTSPPRNGS